MATITRSKTWVSNETLTASDLNAEFDNVLTGANSNSLNQANLSKTDDYTMGSLIVGTNLTSTDGDSIHIHPSTAGSVTADDTGDELVIEKGDNVGMSFLCPANASASIFFGDQPDNNVGSIIYDHGTDMAFTVETTEVLSLSATVATLSSQLTVGVNDTGHDVKFFGATSGAYWLWDESADGVVQIGTLTVGVDDAGHDVKLFGATSGSYALWDESADSLLLTDSTPLKIGDSQDLTLYHDGSNSYITNAVGALKIATETSGIAITIGHGTSETTIADNLTVTGTLTGTLATAAQGSVTSLGTLTALTVDDVAIDGKVVTMTGSDSDTVVFTAGTHGTLSIVTTDAAAAAANIQITADGTAELAGTTVTLDSAADIELEATDDINVPADVGMTFGDDGEKIEGDGTNLTVSSSGLITLTGGGNTVITNSAVISGSAVVVGNTSVGGTLTSTGILSVDSTTDSTSTTTGSIHTDGGLGVAKDMCLGSAIFINETTNVNMTTGLTVMVTGSTQAFCLKHPSVDHGLTSAGAGTSTETDDFFTIQCPTGSHGGAQIKALMEDAAQSTTMGFLAYGSTAAITKNADSLGLVSFEMAEIDSVTGNTLADPTSNGNLFTIRAGATTVTRFIFDFEGSGHSDVEWTTYHKHDDLSVIRDMEAELLAHEDASQTPRRHYMESTGIIGQDSWHMENGKPRAMVNFTKLSMLHHGALIQIGDRFISNEERIDYQQEEIESLKSELRLLRERN